MYRLLLTSLLFLVLVTPRPTSAEGNPLEDYVARADSSFVWRLSGRAKRSSVEVLTIEMTSQSWRSIPWKHLVVVTIPPRISDPRKAFLYLTGSGGTDDEEQLLVDIASRAGIVSAVVTQLPNQPLFGGLTEDRLLSYTFEQYVRTGERDWPILFPMVKAAMRAADVVTQVSNKERGVAIDQFIVSGTSKRAWTTWLLAAVDRRVFAFAPKVFEMINIPRQVALAQRAYGTQSEKIKDYTDRGLVERLSTEPALQKLSEWIDPFTYRARYTQPKLILLGTNDRYWVVDSLREYWSALPGSKWVYQSPNEGHRLGENAHRVLIAWISSLAHGVALPTMGWKLIGDGVHKTLTLTDLSERPTGVSLWKACSSDRDLRSAKWSEAPLALASDRPSRSDLSAPPLGFCAHLIEARFAARTGRPALSLSTEAFVLPQ